MILTVLDFETTGVVKGWPNEPWQLGLVQVRDGKVLPDTKWDTLLHVGERPFSPRAVGRYSELRHELAAAPTVIGMWPEISRRLVGFPLVAHNCSTERTMLTRIAPMTSFGPWIDTLSFARTRYPNLPSHALGDLIAAFGLVPALDALCPGRTWHDALYDACACALLVEFFSHSGLFDQSAFSFSR